MTPSKLFLENCNTKVTGRQIPRQNRKKKESSNAISCVAENAQTPFVVSAKSKAHETAKKKFGTPLPREAPASCSLPLLLHNDNERGRLSFVYLQRHHERSCNCKAHFFVLDSIPSLRQYAALLLIPRPRLKDILPGTRQRDLKRPSLSPKRKKK